MVTIFIFDANHQLLDCSGLVGLQPVFHLSEWKVKLLKNIFEETHIQYKIQITKYCSENSIILRSKVSLCVWK